MTYKPNTTDLPERIRFDSAAPVSDLPDFASRSDMYGDSSWILNNQSKYDFKYLVFPSDLGLEDNGHYMVININVPVRLDGLPNSAFGTGGQFYTLTNDYSKVDRLRLTKAISNGGAVLPTSLRGNFKHIQEVNATQGQFHNFNIPGIPVVPGEFGGRWTKRIAESIAIFMPSSLLYNQQHTFEDISLSAHLNNLSGAAIAGAFSKNPVIGSIMSSVVGSAGRASQLAGFPLSPMIEILFATTPQRQFIFEFMLSPRNHKESVAIKSIIKTLKFHAAPELIAKGFAFLPPAEFDITFFNKGVENTNIPRINTCVLERIEADYSPTGAFSTFSTGHPVAVRLSLGFRELEINHKLRVAQDF